MSVEKISERVWVLRPEGDDCLTESFLAFKQEAEDADPSPHLVIDMNSITEVNSSNLSQLLRLRKYAIDRDVKLILGGVGLGIMEVFERTALNEIFEFAAEVGSATDGLRGLGA